MSLLCLYDLFRCRLTMSNNTLCNDGKSGKEENKLKTRKRYNFGLRRKPQNNFDDTLLILTSKVIRKTLHKMSPTILKMIIRYTKDEHLPNLYNTKNRSIINTIASQMVFGLIDSWDFKKGTFVHSRFLDILTKSENAFHVSVTHILVVRN